MRHFVTELTDLGDSAFLLPASVLLAVYLFFYLRSLRAVGIWLSTLVLCAGLTLIVKIAFEACGNSWSFLDMHSPSGHTSLSATFYGCSALMVTADKERRVRWVLIVASGALIALIAISRVMLEAHTVREVVAGAAVGACCVGWFGLRYFARPPSSLPWQPVIAALAIMALATHGWHLNVEGLIAELARLFRTTLPVCA
jgi:membrane-associated phospholipid phosphatase